jgi:hypothetical protein
MFFRLKKSGPRSYLQIVENRRETGAVRQHVIATVGRTDELALNGGLASLLASGARLCDQVMLLCPWSMAMTRPPHAWGLVGLGRPWPSGGYGRIPAAKR